MFFEKFPVILARVGNEFKNIEDFFLRVAPSEKYNKLANLLTPYFVAGGQRIEDVAFDVYGDQTLHWVILLCNNIVNPYEEWPLDDDVLYKRMFAWYNFTVGVPASHGLVAGDVVSSNNGYTFSVEAVSSERVILKSQVGIAYLSREDFLYLENRGTKTPISIRSVEDPLTTTHHYEEVQSGYWVDFDADLFGQRLIRSVSNLEYEESLNEKKRTIRVLDKRYLSDFIQTFEREIQK